MKCQSCGSILSYDDKVCTICGAPPGQDYEHNKDRSITTLLDVVKGLVSAVTQPSAQTNPRKSSFDFNNPPPQYCLGCGKPMVMRRSVDGYNRDGSPVNCYECNCPETNRNIFKKIFGNEEHYRWRLFLDNSGWKTAGYPDDYL